MKRSTIAIVLSALLFASHQAVVPAAAPPGVREDLKYTGPLSANIDVKAKAGVWEYTIINLDEPGYQIVTFELHDLIDTAQIIGSPRGWKRLEDVMRSAPPGAVLPSAWDKPIIAWVADDGFEIRPGQSLGGFQVSTSTTESVDVRATLVALFVDKDGVVDAGRAAFKYTQGPGARSSIK